MSLTHSYRAPGLADLIALPALSRLNSPTSPDRIGNPALKPELATGIDLAFEHYLERSGIFSANAFIRSIDNLIRRQTTLQPAITGTRWVSAPLNLRHALTAGIELEAKFQWVEFFPNAPAVEFRGNYSRFASRVDDIPGPNNRLDQQPRQTANLGVDYRLAALPLTLGGNLNWTPAYIVQTSESQTSRAGTKRQVDIYGLWKFTPNTQLRLSANNLLHRDYLTGSSMDTERFQQIATVAARTYTSFTARLEIKI
jgi:iron complex outermembrane receptor protein